MCVFCANSHHPALTDTLVKIFKGFGIISLDPQKSSAAVQKSGPSTELPQVNIRQIKNTSNKTLEEVKFTYVLIIGFGD